LKWSRIGNEPEKAFTTKGTEERRGRSNCLDLYVFRLHGNMLFLQNCLYSQRISVAIAVLDEELQVICNKKAGSTNDPAFYRDGEGEA